MRRHSLLNIIFVVLLALPMVRECCLSLNPLPPSHCSHSSKGEPTAPGCIIGRAAIETRSDTGIHVVPNSVPVSGVNSQTVTAAEARVGVTREPILPNSEP